MIVLFEIIAMFVLIVIPVVSLVMVRLHGEVPCVLTTESVDAESILGPLCIQSARGILESLKMALGHNVLFGRSLKAFLLTTGFLPFGILLF